MDIRAYMEQQKDRIAARSRRVKDYGVFDFNHVPERPVMRGECRDLIDALLRFDVTGVATHLAVIGSRGSGKTLTLKYLQRVMAEQTNLQLLYANCRHHNTSYRILAHLLGGDAAGASLSELFERFAHRYGGDGSDPGRTAVVLDEVDLMSPKDKRREILYLLSRSERPFMVILLSNSPQVLNQLDAATRSSLQPAPLHFAGYDAAQIREILLDRARRGLRDWDEGALAKIAALTVGRTNADARVAIKTLYYTVTRAESLEDCFEVARRDIVVDMVNDLSDGNLMILWAAATSRSGLARAVYDRYGRLSRDQGEKPFSYVHFYANLSYLQSMSLIILASTKQGRTYTNRVLVTFDPSTVESICKLRFA